MKKTIISRIKTHLKEAYDNYVERVVANRLSKLS